MSTKTTHEVMRDAYKPPTPSDLASPVAYLKWLENTFRMYAHGKIAWQDVRETLQQSPEVIAGFEADLRADGEKKPRLVA